jgi:hypothetical protein
MAYAHTKLSAVAAVLLVIVLFVCWYAIAANYDYDALAVALASAPIL